MELEMENKEEVKKRQPQMSWSRTDERRLLRLIEQAPNVKAGVEKFARDTGRSPGAVSQRYYQKLRKKDGTETKRRSTKTAVFKVQSSALLPPLTNASPQSYKAYSLPELIKIHDTVKAELRERMRAELERL